MARPPLLRNLTLATPFVLLPLLVIAMESPACPQSIHTDSSGIAAEAPVAISPGSASKLTLIGDACPTFSWGAAAGAQAYDLVVYHLGGQSEDAEPVLRQRIAGSALGWTPSLDRCLEPGGRYAWSVRAVGHEEESRWSRPGLFQVASGPSAMEFEAALEVVRSYLGARGEAVPEVATEEAGESPAETARASAEPPARMAPPGTQLSVDGNVDAMSFSGSGALLTGLDPANLAAGTAGIDISGNAATATEATHATTASDLVCTDCIGTPEIDRAGLDADLLDGLDSTDLAPVSHDHLGEVWFNNTGNGLRIDFFSNDPLEYALWGRLTAATGGADSAAVRGENLSLNAAGYGVLGAHAGLGVGVKGTSQNLGVLGRAGGIGVFGDASASGGAGVWGSATGTSGVNYGVFGETSSASGFAGYFTGRTHIAGPLGIGTTAPAWPLSILGPQAVALLESNASLNGSVLDLRNTGFMPALLGAINFSDGTNTPGQIAYEPLTLSGGDVMTFRAAGAERMRISDLGLHVSGQAALDGGILMAPTQRWYSSSGSAWIDSGCGSINARAYSPVHLPNGAKIREIKAFYCYGGGELLLQRAGGVTIATLPLPASGPGCTSASTTDIALGTETVDNSQYAYEFYQDYCASFYNAVHIRYEITSPLP